MSKNTSNERTERLYQAVKAWDKIRRKVLSIEEGYRAVYRCFSCEGEDIMAAPRECLSDVKDLLRMMDEHRPLLHEFVACDVWLRIEKLAEQLYDFVRMARKNIEEMVFLGNEANAAYYDLLNMVRDAGKDDGK
jgi:hypothetical protein